jgi:hypothetical protein
MTRNLGAIVIVAVPILVMAAASVAKDADHTEHTAGEPLQDKPSEGADPWLDPLTPSASPSKNILELNSDSLQWGLERALEHRFNQGGQHQKPTPAVTD